DPNRPAVLDYQGGTTPLKPPAADPPNHFAPRGDPPLRLPSDIVCRQRASCPVTLKGGRPPETPHRDTQGGTTPLKPPAADPPCCFRAEGDPPQCLPSDI